MRHKLANILKILFVMTLVVSLGCFVGCGGGEDGPNNPPETLEVKFTVEEGLGKVNTEFDVGTILEKEDGVDYTMTATYIYYEEATDFMEERELVCDGLKFTQDKGLFDVYVTVTAKKGDVTATGEINIVIEVTVDELDAKLVDAWHDDNYYAETINNDKAFIKEGASSIKYVYSGAFHSAHDGNQWAFVNGDGSFRGTYEEQSFNIEDGIAMRVTDWATASLVMWIYNPMDEPIEFFARFVNVTNGKMKYDMDWPSADPKYVKTVPAHSWKLVRFELADYGITTPMQYEEYYPLPSTLSPDGRSHYNLGGLNLNLDPPLIGTDFVALKSRYTAQPEEGFFTYYFYADSFEYVDEDIADAMDPDYEHVEREDYGTAPSGIHEDAIPFSGSNGVKITLPTITNDKTIAIDVKFGGAANQDTQISFCLRGAGDGQWLNVYGYYHIYADGTPKREYNGFTITELEGGWWRFTIDLSVADETFESKPNPEAIGTIDVYGGSGFTTASGYIMFMGVVE